MGYMLHACSLLLSNWLVMNKFSPRMAAEGDVWKETLDDLMLLCNRYPELTQQIVPEIHDYLHTILQPQPLISPEQWLWSILERGSDTFFSHFAFCAPGDGVPQNAWKCCGNHLSSVHLPHLTLSDEKFNYPKRTCQIEWFVCEFRIY